MVRRTAAGALLGLATMLAPASGAAQEKPVDVAVRAGAALPVAGLADYADPGVNLGAGAAWRVAENLSFRLDGDMNALQGAGATGPDMRLWHVGGGLEFGLGEMERSRWSLDANVGAGAMVLDTDPLNGDPESDITQTYPDVNAGVELGYRVTDNVKAAVGTRGFIAFTDEDDLDPLRMMNPTGAALNRAVVFPVTAMLSIDVPR